MKILYISTIFNLNKIIYLHKRLFLGFCTHTWQNKFYNNLPLRYPTTAVLVTMVTYGYYGSFSKVISSTLFGPTFVIKS